MYGNKYHTLRLWKRKMPKILLINYSEQEANQISEDLGIETHRGFLADSGKYTVSHSGVSTPIINFYIPESFAEYQSVFINFNINDKVKQEFESKAKDDYEEGGKHFLADYWFNNRGYLVIFTGKDLVSPSFLGVPIEARPALQTDKTARLGLRIIEKNPLRVSLAQQLKNIKMPASHYLSPQDDEAIKKYLNSGHLDRAYTNSSSKAIGVYIDSNKDENDYGWEDSPQAFVFPTFKSLKNITIALTRTFSTLSPKFLPLQDSEWMTNDEYYPNTVTAFQDEINETKQLAEQKIQELEQAKTKEISRFSAYTGILTQTGDELVESVKWLMSDVLGLDVVDVDAEGEAGNLKEDLLITKDDGSKILAEIKGTKSEYPSPKYIGQATNHFIRKSKLGAEKCVLVINHDYETEPRIRKQAYTGDDADLLESVEYVSYLDTRVLHKICLSVANGNLSKQKAIEIINSRGRIEFDDE